MATDSVPQNLETVRTRIRDACLACGRKTDSVRLLAVSKTKPLSMVDAAAAIGQRHFGENYLQEALAKTSARPDLTWHFIGAIQSNKTRDIATNFSWVHTVASTRIARRLSDARLAAELTPLKILLQVNINREPGKAGILPDALPALVESILPIPHLIVTGLMALPENTADITRQRANFAELAELQRATSDHFGLPGFVELSMGMSHDLEAAISQGATWVRIGTDVFGARTPK